jgi:hypothetical protein
MSNKFATIRRLLEADFYGAEPDLGTEPDLGMDPMGDDMSFDPMSSEPQPADDLPNITLSETQKAIMALIAAMPASPLVVKQKLDQNQNAIEAIKQLISTGLVTVDLGQYKLSDTGTTMLRQLDLTDDSGAITSTGKQLAVKHLY